MHREPASAIFENGTLTGYGTIRRATDGWKIGPLFADAPPMAETLITTLTAAVRSEHILMDIPEPNETARAIALRLALTPAFETARMYRGAAPSLPLDRIFGTTLELG